MTEAAYRFKSEYARLKRSLPSFVDDIKRRTDVLTRGYNDANRVFITRPGHVEDGKFLADIVTDFYQQLRNLEFLAANPGEYITAYAHPNISDSNKQKLMSTIARQSDTRNVSDFFNQRKKQFWELDPSELAAFFEQRQRELESMDPDQNNLFARHTGKLLAEMNTSHNMNGCAEGDNKPPFFSPKDTKFDCLRNIDGLFVNGKPTYMPEYARDAARGSDDMTLSKSRQLVIGDNNCLHEIKLCSKSYIARDFFETDDVDRPQLPQSLYWSPLQNKVWVQCFAGRPLLFPVRMLSTSKFTSYNFLKTGTYTVQGMVIYDLVDDANPSKIRPVYIFLLDDGLFYNYRANEVYPDWYLRDHIAVKYIELNVSMQVIKQKYGAVHIYRIKDAIVNCKLKNGDKFGVNQYLLSPYTLDTIRAKYAEWGLDTVELSMLVPCKYGRTHPGSPIWELTEADASMQGGEYARMFNRYVFNTYPIETVGDVVPFKPVVDEKATLNLSKSINLEQIRRYDPMHHIATYFDSASVKFDTRNLPYKLPNNGHLLKSKFVTWDQYDSLFFLCRLYNLSSPDKVLLASKNYACIEPFVYYNPNIDIDHLHYDPVIYNSTGRTIKNKIKELYSGNISKDEPILQARLSGTYEVMVFDITQSRNGFWYNEEEIAPLLAKSLELMRTHLAAGGTCVFTLPFKTKNTLKALQQVASSFEKVHIFKKTTFTKYMYSIASFVCMDFAGSLSRFDGFRSGFLECVQKFFDDQVRLYDGLSKRSDAAPSVSQSVVTSLQVADFLGFKTYTVKGSVNVALVKALQDVFSYDEPVDVKFRMGKPIKLCLSSKKAGSMPEEVKQMQATIAAINKQIDMRPIEAYYISKRQTRVYERSLPKRLFELGVSINDQPVSRAWLKLWEIMHDTNLIPQNKRSIKTFHLCEAPGNFIHSIGTFLKMKGIKHDWNATTLCPTCGNPEAFGDMYGMIKANPSKWSYGADGTGDVTRSTNIKYYQQLCSDADIIIGDCGMAYPTNGDKEPSHRLFASQIAFILYNLKQGGNFLFKHHIGEDARLFLDLYYILYNSFESLTMFKPVQNKNSPEYYVVGTGFRKDLSLKDLNTILDAATSDKNDITTTRLVTTLPDAFLYQYLHAQQSLIDSYVHMIEKQLFLCDFMEKLTTANLNTIRANIDYKNMDWIKRYMPNLAD